MMDDMKNAKAMIKAFAILRVDYFLMNLEEDPAEVDEAISFHSLVYSIDDARNTCTRLNELASRESRESKYFWRARRILLPQTYDQDL